MRESDREGRIMIKVIKKDGTKEEFNVHIFKKLATKAINDISSRGKIPIIVGGTGFYTGCVI